MFEMLAGNNNSKSVCGIRKSMTANHWLFFVIPSRMVIVRMLGFLQSHG